MKTEMAKLADARRIAAAHFHEVGRDDIERAVLAGQGDDFPEVQVALLAIRDLGTKLERFKRALDAYADRDFWGDGDCYAALAFHDQGEIARAALAGNDILAYTAG